MDNKDFDSDVVIFKKFLASLGEERRSRLFVSGHLVQVMAAARLDLKINPVAPRAFNGGRKGREESMNTEPIIQAFLADEVDRSRGEGNEIYKRGCYTRLADKFNVRGSMPGSVIKRILTNDKRTKRFVLGSAGE